MPNVLITGANRGIGLEFVRQFLERGDQVFATVRAPVKAEQLKALEPGSAGKLSIVAMDVADVASVGVARDLVAQQADSLDLLINNAGILPNSGQERLGALDFVTGQDVMRVNAVAPVIVAQTFAPLLKRGRGKIVSITSGWGSVSSNAGDFPYWYSGSKAALNMMMRSMAGDVGKDGMICVVINPGWVKTDMGTDAAPLIPQQSVAGMLRVIDGLGESDNGKFYNHEGGEEPW